MEKIQIKFNDVADVNKFVHVVSGYDSDVDLYCGSYCVDAKSILGIMTIDLRNQMWVTCNGNRQEKERLVNDLSWVAVA
ncbi:MAG: HPr family phosphocarrier protein [Lachnospiraceae bacterium]|jgi:Phosphotransferase system, HPr-related proteins|nr:HPr family phosphocarrier protein [Lachnospiraceae bacterium]MCI8780074.1 HPr family phosphocarrier protein [Lachnospiraceae bacterium]RKI41788.1 HPr family phosphocarrier protein [bacterium D16-59]RKI60464.1 HPr family phosphocarrier protein [bacterium D16-51]